VTLTARHAVMICTGSRPALPELPGLAEARPWTNRQATDSHTVPRRLAIAGGGGSGWSLVPSVNVVVTNPAGEVLLIRRSDNDHWAVPGGAIDLGESLVKAALRETREETGIECEVTGVAGIYTDPRHVILYTSNGEARQEFSIVLTARATGGEPARSEESSEVRWVPRKDLDGYSMDRSMRLRIGHYLEGRATPYLG